MTRPKSRRHPLAIALCAVLGGSALMERPYSAMAMPPAVTNCDDFGSGSLRAALASSQTFDGDTIDLTHLTCGPIKLDADELMVPFDNLTIEGPGAGNLTIDGNHAHRVFHHVPATIEGTLALSGLSIVSGTSHGNGGCISSRGSISLADSVVTGCTALAAAPSGVVYGGGIYAANNIGITRSALTANSAYAMNAGGGGAFARGDFNCKYCLFSDNKAAASDSALVSQGGGVMLRANSIVVASTFARNSADFGGAISADGMMLTIDASTFASNEGTSGGTAIRAAGDVAMSTVTVADNMSARGAAVEVDGTLDTNLSLFSGNEYAFGSQPRALDIDATITGSGNIIMAARRMLPPDTITTCPRLGPLADNGGMTPTMALLHDHPNSAIDAGGDQGPTADQRGFARPFGAHLDIGAFEWRGESDDRILRSQFEPVCD